MLLCGTACHALRDPLHALMGTLELLSEDTTLSQEQQADMNVRVTCVSLLLLFLLLLRLLLSIDFPSVR